MGVFLVVVGGRAGRTVRAGVGCFLNRDGFGFNRPPRPFCGFGPDPAVLIVGPGALQGAFGAMLNPARAWRS